MNSLSATYQKDNGIARVYEHETKEILNLVNDVYSINSEHALENVLPSGFPPSGKLDTSEKYFFRVDRLSFDDETPYRESMENVLLSLGNENLNFVYTITGTERDIDLCIGVVNNTNDANGNNLYASDYGKIIEKSFSGNFNGSITKTLTGDTLKKFEDTSKYDYAGVITGVPSVNENKTGDKSDFQGIDRLINSMMGKSWRLVVVCQAVSKDEIKSAFQNVYKVYERLSLYKKRWQHNETMEHTESSEKSDSDRHTKGKQYDKSWQKSKDVSESKKLDEDGDYRKDFIDRDGHSKQINKSKSYEHSHTENFSERDVKNRTDSFSVEMVNKNADEMMKYIDDELLERLKLGRGKGLFKTSVYYMAENQDDSEQLKAGIISLFQGNKSTLNPLCAHEFKIDDKATMQKILSTYQNHSTNIPITDIDALSLLSRPFSTYRGEQILGLNTYLTAQEVSLFAGLPMKEVAGLPMKTSVEFGLNVKYIDEDDRIEIGKIMHNCKALDNFPFYISKKSISKHIFIGGVTGGGKTNTCHKLLSESVDMKIPFLVIEPAKTEYRSLMNDKKNDVTIFTVGNETCAPIRINPFELVKGELLSSHISMIKATFTSAFPMEGSMPQIIEETIISCYEKKGWDINESTHENGDDAYKPNSNAFPVMSDFIAELSAIVDTKDFGSRLGSEYKGTLVSRVSNLVKGNNGAILDCENSNDFEYIATHNVIIEMEEVKDPEHKALLMGFILARLTAVIKNLFYKYKKREKQYQHITLIEEAHRLLAKAQPGDAGSKRAAVETFADLLAEVRKYGEGLIVVDQIPNKLTPEVLKNTNTKIIHKILAKDDKEAVGDTMLMDDKQKEFLSALEVGEAIVFTEQTIKPVHVLVEKNSKDESEPDNEEVRSLFEKKKEDLGGYYEYSALRKLHPIYANVAAKLSEIKIDKNQCEELNKDDKELFDKLKKQVTDAAQKNYDRLDKEKIWKLLIKRYDTVTGKAMSANDKRDERLEFLTDFFINTFDKKNITKADIPFEISGKDYLKK